MSAHIIKSSGYKNTQFSNNQAPLTPISLRNMSPKPTVIPSGSGGDLMHDEDEELNGQVSRISLINNIIRRNEIESDFHRQRCFCAGDTEEALFERRHNYADAEEEEEANRLEWEEMSRRDNEAGDLAIAAYEMGRTDMVGYSDEPPPLCPSSEYDEDDDMIIE